MIGNDIREALGSTPAYLLDALEVGVALEETFEDTLALGDVCAHLNAGLVRHGAIHHLARVGQAAEFELVRHQNDGIELVQGCMCVKVLKSGLSGQIQPQKTGSMKRFLVQGHLAPSDGTDPEEFWSSIIQGEKEGMVNIVADWHVEDGRVALFLSKPSGMSSNGCAVLDWRFKVLFDEPEETAFVPDEDEVSIFDDEVSGVWKVRKEGAGDVR